MTDDVKVKKTKEIGITLVHVPYWWDKKISSLRATIATIRPDIVGQLNKDDVPIPLEPITNRMKAEKRRKNEIKGKLMLATNWNKEDDPTGW